MIVMDSCTVILLAKASVLEAFAEVHEARITGNVLDEVLKGKEKMQQDALLLERLHKEGKIVIIEHSKAVAGKLMKDFNMGKGEASTVAAAIGKNCVVATDNKQGRKAAAVNNLGLVGSPEITVSLYKKKEISKEKAAASIKTLKKEGWFGSYLIEKALEDVK